MKKAPMNNYLKAGLILTCFLTALILLGWACGWGADALRRKIAHRKEKTE